MKGVFMKRIYLFCSRLWVFWIEIPLAFLLAVSIYYNNFAEGFVKLYPMITVLIAAIIFVPIFFFRIIELSYSDIKYIGLFTSRDRAIINEGKLLKIKMLPRGKVRLLLIGHDEIAGFDWLKPGEDEPNDITLFRGTTFGGKYNVKRILRYFGTDHAEFGNIFSKKQYRAEYEYATISTSHPDDGMEIDIRITTTI